MSNQIWRMTAAQLADGIRAGELTAVEVVEAHLARISTTNPTVNAVVSTLGEEAVTSARAVDQSRSRGEKLGPLAGVPFTVKNNIDVAGTATTHGVPALANAIAPGDAPVVARLRRAGAIPIGRTNLPDLSLRFDTWSSLHGATVNPWNPLMSPGGSSGGEGVAVAVGMSPLGIGNDSGGSVRVPAAFGGVASLKPSFARLPMDQIIGPRDSSFASQIFPVIGFLARSIRDLDLALSLTVSPDPRDPRVVPAPLKGPAPVTPIRVAVCPDPGGRGVHPDVASAVERAAVALRDAGYATIHADIPRVEDAVAAFGTLVMSEFQFARPMIERLMAPQGLRYIDLALQRSPPAGLERYLQCTAVRQGIQRDWVAFLSEFPLILGPVFTEPAVPVGFDILGPDEHEIVNRAMRLCVAGTFVGAPAVTVPVGVVNSMPLSVQILASPFREDLCLDAASAIESRLGVLTLTDPRG